MDTSRLGEEEFEGGVSTMKKCVILLKDIMPLSGSARKVKSKSKSRSRRAGLYFPVGRIHRYFKRGKYSKRVGARSSSLSRRSIGVHGSLNFSIWQVMRAKL
ncbi:Late histone H2A.L3 [Armadillidium vulgare]|nr:Late histone H2A.L3 [Armadillidium vulgare]